MPKWWKKGRDHEVKEEEEETAYKHSTTKLVNMSLSKEKTELERAVERLHGNDPTVTKLSLRYESIDDEGARALAGALEKNNILTDLSLHGNHIGDVGAGALADALEKNDTLTFLKLTENNIGAEGARAFSGALEKNNTLTMLLLSGNKIRGEGAGALANALEKNSTLTYLYLSTNKIMDEGARAFAGALEKNTTLTKLNLESNYIGDVGAGALADALKKNDTLTQLKLTRNSIKDEGAVALAGALEKNTTLTDLCVYGYYTSDFYEATKERISKSLKRNETKGEEWKAVVKAKAEAEAKRKAAKRKAEAEAEAKRKAEAEAEANRKIIEELRKQLEGEAKGTERTTEPVPVIGPEDCKVMVSFNDYSAGEDAEKLANYLTSNGHPTFCTRLFCPGNPGSWRYATVAGVDSCKYYVMLLTNGWQKSNECQFETDIAVNRWAKKDVTLIPVWYDDFDEDFDKKGGLDREGNSVKGKRYGIQFQSTQSIYHTTSADKWMQDILKLLPKEN